MLMTTLLLLGAQAEEGMWLPEQLSAMTADLQAAGLKIPVEDAVKLTDATVFLGNCTGAFVSSDGLVITNAHCIADFLQFADQEHPGIAENGFLAKTRAEEVWAGPAARIWVSERLSDVTRKIAPKVASAPDDLARYQLVERTKKEFVAACEADGKVRCDVATFWDGAEFRMVSRAEFRDVRIVYVPPMSVALFGGDTDNWTWPRHANDIVVLRAYMAPYGGGVAHAADNIPYKPPTWLKVSTQGVTDGDFVMMPEYPARTYRYRTAAEVKHAGLMRYPDGIDLYGAILAPLRDNARRSKVAAQRLRPQIEQMSNTIKNFEGNLDAFGALALSDRKSEGDRQLHEWIAAKGKRDRKFGDDLAELGRVLDEELAELPRERLMQLTTWTPRLLMAARAAYRLASEKVKPDIERRSGFQQRDEAKIADQIEQLGASLYLPAERDLLRVILTRSQALPANRRIPPYDQLIAASGGVEEALDRLFERPSLPGREERRAQLAASRADLEKSDNPWMQLAVSLERWDEDRRKLADARQGAMLRLRPTYIEAIRAMREGQPMYPDANATLRVSYGHISGYSPTEAVLFGGRTSGAGMLAKLQPDNPDFYLPAEFVPKLRLAPKSRWADTSLGSVPIGFSSTLDNTGGSSGAPTLNANGELVGLVFDRNYEGMASDWMFDADVTRSIHADLRFTLWMLSEVVDGKTLLQELGVP